MTGQLMHDQTSSLVRERDRRRLRAMGAVLALGGLLVGGVLGYVWLQVQRVRVSYEMEDLRALRADVEEQNRKLRLELSSLRSYARVESEARRDMRNRLDGPAARTYRGRADDRPEPF